MTFIDKLIGAEDNIVLRKIQSDWIPNVEPKLLESEKFLLNPRHLVCFLDLETTGLIEKEDKIIEIALKLAAVNAESGELIGVLYEYQSFNDPKEPIDEEVTRINGITNEMVQDQSIDWEVVHNILNTADIIVAHNARFDRGFMDRYIPISKEKIWACSVNDIDWINRGFTSSKQELLCNWHGFYYDSHRAMSDVDALIYLVTHQFQDDVSRYILELVQNAYKSFYYLKIPFRYDEAKKDKAKANKYRWDGTVWSKILNDSNQIDEEVRWAEENIYDGHFSGTVEEIPLTEKYK